MRAVIAACLVFAAGAFSSATAEPIRGAGSTFAAPIIEAWAAAYEEARADGGDYSSPDWTVDYEPVGSLAGLMRLQQPDLDFAATDVPVAPEALAQNGQRQFPVVMGAVAIIVNLEGMRQGGLRLSGATLADIYLGKIQRWSDPAIVETNPGVGLPDLRISVLHRKDGSGSTYAFTEYLSAVSPQWQTAYGRSTSLTWPIGTGVKGTRDLITAVKATPGAIAYAEFGQAERSGLQMPALQNSSGHFVLPGAPGVQAAAQSVDWSGIKDFHVSLANRPGADAFPISAATFVIIPAADRSEHRSRRVQDLFRLAFSAAGSKAALELGYVPLPPALARQVEDYWASRAVAGH
ncbi:phosphate-binding protein PstS [Agaricicola taiwanensis]|uniref:Phosphate-binding protein PstS n=1 Tax=Agaricicola taiwanensis TaxID=591372 RepID=A0A8J2VN54_9RHOB|nr:phosphate-binding protein PstS [Agaricicola taiwanensis]